MEQNNQNDKHDTENKASLESEHEEGSESENEQSTQHYLADCHNLLNQLYINAGYNGYHGQMPPLEQTMECIKTANDVLDFIQSINNEWKTISSKDLDNISDFGIDQGHKLQNRSYSQAFIDECMNIIAMSNMDEKDIGKIRRTENGVQLKIQHCHNEEHEDDYLGNSRGKHNIYTLNIQNCGNGVYTGSITTKTLKTLNVSDKTKAITKEPRGTLGFAGRKKEMDKHNRHDGDGDGHGGGGIC